MLKQTYFQLLENYTDDTSFIEKCWLEIETQYTHSKRHYHTLSHLENLLTHLQDVKEEITDWNTVLFTLFYHDVIYNSLKSDNEEKSADLAVERMKQLSIPDRMIESCKQQILATKSHLANNENDTNFFTDADLSILGSSWEAYSIYAKNVRKEYAIYPDLVYNPGRKKVLNHFLSMERIYKTDVFHNKFDVQARLNLKRELELI